MKDSREEILHFWFKETSPPQWFQNIPDFDAQVRERFLVCYELARDGLCDNWNRNAEGALALCLLLGQFPRNMFRGQAAAFATDKKAILVAKQSLVLGFDQILPPERRRFVYLPFEHSENMSDQRKAVSLFEKMKGEDPLSYERAVRHLNIIEKFGRFPHRNAVLGRTNTPEEEEFLAQKAS